MKLLQNLLQAVYDKKERQSCRIGNGFFYLASQAFTFLGLQLCTQLTVLYKKWGGGKHFNRKKKKKMSRNYSKMFMTTPLLQHVSHSKRDSDADKQLWISKAFCINLWPPCLRGLLTIKRTRWGLWRQCQKNLHGDFCSNGKATFINASGELQ